MSIPKRSSSLEILESRIAPAALYFVQSASLEVHKADGTSAQDSNEENGANSTAGSTAAVLLKMGDSLIFDADNSNSLTEGDTVLAKVKTGQAMVFLTELDSSSSFSKNEITGLALSNGFSGSVFTDVNGSIVTSLNSAGGIDVTESGFRVTESSITSLHVTGQINGSVLAGKNLNDLQVGGKLFNNGDQYSVSGTIATGTATNGQYVSFNGGGAARGTEYVQPAGASGGNITKVSLDFGAASIMAGDGSDVIKGKAGVGGSISGLTVTESMGAMSVFAGNGGNVSTGPGTGGAGGSISKSSVSEHATINDGIRYLSGQGGSSANGNGGAGGAISELSVTVRDTAEYFAVIAGQGGGGGTKGTGGAGGGLSKITVSTQGMDDGGLAIQAGFGGDSGGTGGKGGAGGAVKTVVLTTAGTRIDGTIELEAGDGGDGISGGGAGGLLTGVTANVGTACIGVDLKGGDGGNSSGTGAGGVAGSLTKVVVTGQATIGSLDLTAGDGGDGRNSAGKSGGLVQQVEIKTLASGSSVSVASGAGGSVIGAGNGGAGGALSGVTYENRGGVGNVSIFSGAGGSVNAETESLPPTYAKGNAGSSGVVSGVIINNYADISNSALIYSGIAGGVSNSGSSRGHGGNSGAVSKVVINDFSEDGTTGSFNIYAGSGKFGTAPSGAGAGTKGGSIGSIKDITLDAPSSHVVIGSDIAQAGASGSGASAVAGSGGLITNIHGAVGVLDVIAVSGGSSSEGKGGAGGSITKVNVTTTGADHFIHLLAAGNGGSGGTIKTAGAGGSVTGIKTTGNIGDFTKAFGLSSEASDQGGISAGLSGDRYGANQLNGSVSDITATGIATIIAGRPSATSVTDVNGVSKLAKIKASILGANTGIAGNSQEPSANEGTFDFNDNNENGVYNLNSSDEVIDGLILVRGTVAPALPVTPLKLILTGNTPAPVED